MVLTKRVLAMTVFARSIKVLGWRLRSASSREHNFPKEVLVFEIHRTSDTHLGNIAPSNHACGLCRTCTIQGGVDKFNKSDSMATRCRKTSGARLSEKKTSWFFVDHRIPDTHMGTLSNRAYGMYKTNVQSQ